MQETLAIRVIQEEQIKMQGIQTILETTAAQTIVVVQMLEIMAIV